MSVIRYSAEAKADALQRVHLLQAQGYSRRNAAQLVSAQVGCRCETLNAWLRRDASQQRNPHPAVHDARLQRLEREVRQLQRINADLRQELQQLERRLSDADQAVEITPARQRRRA
ncbi:hypothetical protein SAMN05428989_1670 [Pseudoxanthomonas sp. GM95]|uniref:hypothetical protein n=1 Tax=Pseudoxanthomonas sp. GM95 TaxID=1881043 RepID=UPI0008AC1A75|nr:hypothetical protein [Pseudoxanthomonas sp. GM95]SEL44896.1 hypothetical protein SAMN05428989_1670 [Pseudoxanthomonas sp. GM95]